MKGKQKPSKKMLVNRATNLWREPVARPPRLGKTAKDRARSKKGAE